MKRPSNDTWRRSRAGASRFVLISGAAMVSKKRRSRTRAVLRPQSRDSREHPEACKDPRGVLAIRRVRSLWPKQRAAVFLSPPRLRRRCGGRSRADGSRFLRNRYGPSSATLVVERPTRYPKRGADIRCRRSVARLSASFRTFTEQRVHSLWSSVTDSPTFGLPPFSRLSGPPKQHPDAAHCPLGLSSLGYVGGFLNEHGDEADLGSLVGSARRGFDRFGWHRGGGVFGTYELKQPAVQRWRRRSARG